MLIDWFTVGAQAVNFVILVWLLKRFLYRPILDAIDAREARIAAALADAAKKQAAAQQQRQTYRHKLEEIEAQRSALLQRAVSKAAAEHQRLLDQSRQAADALGRQRREQLLRELSELKASIRSQAQVQVFAMVRKTLKDLADRDLESAMVGAFLRRLKSLDADSKDRFFEALTQTREPLQVRSAFELSEAEREALTEGLVKLFGQQEITFDCCPDRISGIEVSANGRSLAWGIVDYLQALERQVAKQIEEQTSSWSQPGSDTPSEVLPEEHAEQE